MKRKILLIAVLSLAFSAPMLAHASDGGGKNLCLLNSENCPDRSMDIIHLISTLKAELGKGSAVYTDGEMRILSAKLEDYNKLLEQMQTGP